MRSVILSKVMITLLFVLSGYFAKAQRWEWTAGTLPLVNNAASIAYKVDIDNQGNIYSLVGASKTIELANNTYSHPIADSLDYFLLTKQLKNGSFETVTQIYSDDDLFQSSLKTDALNNIYVLGTLKGTKLYVGGPQHLISFDQPNINSHSGNKMFLLKLDSSGNLIWAKTGTTIDSSVFTYIAAAGITTIGTDIYISGIYNGGPFAFVNSELTETNWPNSFVIKVNDSGNVAWVQQSTGDYGNFLTDLTTDGHSIYVTGQYRNSIEFGNAALYVPTYPNDNERIFLFKFDTSGSAVWAKEEGGPYRYSGTYLYGNAPRKIVADRNGSVYVGGSYQDITGGAGNGVIQQPFLSKYNANTGDLSWTNTDFSPGFPNEINGIMIDSALDIICFGRYRGDFTAGNITFPNDPVSKSMLLKFQSNSGSVVQAQSIGMHGKQNSVRDVCMAPDKSFYIITGIYNDTIQLDTLSLIDGGWAGSAFWFKYLFSNPSSIASAKAIKSNIVIYPNPAYSLINLSTDKISEGHVTLKNSIGGIVFRKYWNLNMGGIDISYLSPGWYYLELEFRGQIAQAVFIKK